MKLVSSKNNILLAIKTISSNDGRNTKGLDNLTFNDLMKIDETELIKLIRRKIKWEKPVGNRVVYIPKKNGKKRKLGIGSITDRITQQCYLNILVPITEGRFSPNSFGFRPNVNTKHAFAKAVNGLWKSNRKQYIIDIDFESYFDTVHINIVLDKLRQNFGVTDCIFLHNLKRLLWCNSDDGVGLPQGSILGPVLSNVLLDDLDRIYDSFISALGSKDKGMWKSLDTGKWNNLRKGIPYIRYCRYADDIRITTSSESQVLEILEITRNWCTMHKVHLSEEKTSFYDVYSKPEISMVGFTGRKGPNGLIISPTDQKQVIDVLRKKVKLSKIKKNPSQLIATFIALMNQYDICTNNNWMIKYIEGVLNNTKRGGYKIDNTLHLTENGNRLYHVKAPNRDGYIVFQPWIIRKHSNQSISAYLKSPFIRGFGNVTERVDCVEYIVNNENDYNGKLIMYLPGLLHRQKFKCFVTGQLLSPHYVDIHHKIPSSKGGSDQFTNLVLLSRDIHQSLHGIKVGMNIHKTLPKYKQLEKLI